VYVLKQLDAAEIVNILKRALADRERGLAAMKVTASDEVIESLARAADGDGRRSLVLLELAADLSTEQDDGTRLITDTHVQEVVRGSVRYFDRGGDLFYEQISALHKAVRGSDPDAALYWFCRMVDGGCDPNYVARRVVRMANEDIGNADPRALQIALDAWNVFERLGSPEGELAIAQAVLYLASTAKSNASYSAYKAATEFVKTTGNLEVPHHLRNAPTGFMKDLGFGRDYRYDPDEEEGLAAGQTYFPDGIKGPVFYEPVDRGLEKQIAEKLELLRKQR